jgi:hypothetical protein
MLKVALHLLVRKKEDKNSLLLYYYISGTGRSLASIEEAIHESNSSIVLKLLLVRINNFRFDYFKITHIIKQLKDRSD